MLSHKLTKIGTISLRQPPATALLLIAVVTLLGACSGNTEKAPTQSVARVNGSDITISQLNDELSRSNVSVAQKETATKFLLETLIDRQLILEAALREKVDRDPQVMQTLERARSQILSQAYLQKRFSSIDQPSKEEIARYFNTHPELFSQSKIYSMHELRLATRDVNPDFDAFFDKATSLDEVANWLQVHNVLFARDEMARAAADLPQTLLKILASARKGKLFAHTEGDYRVLVDLVETKDNPVSFEMAAPQIGQFLLNEKIKASADAEVKRLRGGATVVYLNEPRQLVGPDHTVTHTAPAKTNDNVGTPTNQRDAATEQEHMRRGAEQLR